MSKTILTLVIALLFPLEANAVGSVRDFYADTDKILIVGGYSYHAAPDYEQERQFVKKYPAISNEEIAAHIAKYLKKELETGEHNKSADIVIGGEDWQPKVTESSLIIYYGTTIQFLTIADKKVPILTLRFQAQKPIYGSRIDGKHRTELYTTNSFLSPTGSFEIPINSSELSQKLDDAVEKSMSRFAKEIYTAVPKNE